MNHYSKKRQKLNREYSKRAKEFKEAHPVCQVPKCNGASTDIHHKKGRIGKNLMDESTWIAVCRGHHIIIEKRPEWAKANGFSLSRLTA